MKIAYYSHYFVPEIGAPSARIHDLGREWAGGGHHVQVMTCVPNHPMGRIYEGYRSRVYQREVLDGLHVHRYWTYVTPNKGFLKKTIGHMSFLVSSVLLSGKIDRPEVVIGTSPTFFAAIAAERVARRFDVPFVMEVRDLWPAVFVELGVLKNRSLIRLLENIELWLYRRAARVVTVTEAFRRDLIRRGVPEGKVVTIANGANLDFWDSSAGDGGLREAMSLVGKTVILYIGAHGISQALRAILAAAAALRERTDIEFLFVGEGAEKEALVAFAREHALGNIRFLDPLDKGGVRAFYALADICLVPLRDIPLFDTFIPSKMFEMLAMEKPIIASVRGEAAEILQRSGGAVVVPPEDSAAIAAAVVRLASDSALRRKMGASGRRFVADNYSRTLLARRYDEVLADAVEAHRRRP